MPDTPPTPPGDLPTDIVDGLDGCSPERLRQIARYAEELAEYRERAERLTEEESDDVTADDLPDDVPSKATITIKEINENRYYYWQWRDGDKIRSKYKGPVTDED